MAQEREMVLRVKMDSSGAKKGSVETVKAVKDVRQETGKTSKEVKGFSSVLGNAATGVAAFEGPLGSTAGRLSTFATITRRTEGVLNSKIAALGRFRVALAATGIGLVIVALGTLIQAFRSTQEGTDRLNRVLVPTKAVLSAIWGVVQNLSVELVDRLAKAWRDPGQAAADFGQLIQRQVVNRLLAIGQASGRVGQIVSRLFRGDFAGANEAVSDLRRDVLQFVTGMDDAEERLLNFGRGIGEVSREAFEGGRRLQELNQQIEQLQIDQAVPLARLNREYRELINVARDTTLTEQERLEAIDRALEARREITEEEMKLLDLEIERLEIQQSFNDTSREEQLELQKLIARREELIARTEQELGRRLSMRNSIVQQIEDERKAEEQAAREAMEALEARADKFREVLLSEEHMRVRQHERELQALRELLEEEIITREEYMEIRRELEERLAEDLQGEEEARVGSILELEARLAEARIEFRKAVGDEERLQHAVAIQQLEERIKKMREVGKVEEEEAEKSKKARMNTSNAVREIARGDARAAIKAIFAEAVALQIRNVIASIPFPANLLAAGGAAAAVTSMESLVPGFLRGGLTSPGHKVIQVNEDNRPEFVVNAESTRRALPLLQSLNNNPGFAASLTRQLAGSQFAEGGLTGRPMTGVDAPVRPAPMDLESIAAAVREGMQGAIVEARVAITEVDERLKEHDQWQQSIGN